MGDQADLWKEHREIIRVRKAARMEKVPEVVARLTALGYSVLSFSEQHHRVNSRVDWWPSTGYWKTVNLKDGQKPKSGHGLQSMLKFLATPTSQREAWLEDFTVEVKRG